jgi:hypothetical protein
MNYYKAAFWVLVIFVVPVVWSKFNEQDRKLEALDQKKLLQQRIAPRINCITEREGLWGMYPLVERRSRMLPGEENSYEEIRRCEEAIRYEIWMEEQRERMRRMEERHR